MLKRASGIKAKHALDADDVLTKEENLEEGYNVHIYVEEPSSATKKEKEKFNLLVCVKFNVHWIPVLLALCIYVCEILM